MGFFDDIVSDAKSQARDRLNGNTKWRCAKCGKVVVSEDAPRKSIVSMANDPCPGAATAGDWHDYRRA